MRPASVPHGELNWKGQPGEQQMRRQIEQLLREKPGPLADRAATRESP